MRSLADHYRDHFPAVITGHVFYVPTRHYRHSWLEVTPGPTPDTYAIPPGARSGELGLNYALEENNSAVGAGTVVWMRHRDEQGQLHFAFLAPQSSRVIIYGPPPDGDGSPPSGDPGGGGPGHGDPTRDYCLSVVNVSGCDCFTFTETMTELASLETWGVSGSVCDGVGLQVRLRFLGEGFGYELSFEWLDVPGLTETFTVESIPYSAELAVDNPACTGTVRVAINAGNCSPGGGGGGGSGGGGGGGDCGVIIGGKICYDCDTTFSFCNVEPFPVTTAVCPIFSYLVGGDGILVERTSENEITITATGGAGGGRVPIVTGLAVQKQTMLLPAGFVTSDPECVSDPEDCCGGTSGGGDGTGCCFPRPTDDLWAALFGASDLCGCLLACVHLVYDAGEDAWFSTEAIAGACGHSNDRFLRLKCYGGTYHLDVVDAGHVLVLVGTAFYGPTCDPYLFAATFSDGSGEVCSGEGGFGYLISESECTPGSGSGGGGGGGGGEVDTACCPGEPLPTILYATFGGSLAALGTLTLAWNGVTWTAIAPAGTCMSPVSTPAVTLSCLEFPDGHEFVISCSGSDGGFNGQGSADSCAPFHWAPTLSMVGACGPATVVITE